MKCLNSAAAVRKIAVSFMAALAVCGSFPSTLLATEDKHVVERDGRQISAVGFHTGKTLDLRHPDNPDKVYDFANDDRYIVTVPAHSEIYAKTTAVKEGNYDIDRLDSSDVEFDFLQNEYWHEDISGMCGASIPDGGTKIHLVNKTDKECTVKLRYERFDKITMNETGIMRLPVYENEFLTFYMQPKKYDNYVFRLDFFTDDKYSKEDRFNGEGGALYTTFHLTHDQGEWFGDFGGSIIIDPDIEIKKDGYMTVSLTKETDISDYNLIYNDGLYKYDLKVNTDGYYYVIDTKGDTVTRTYEYLKTGDTNFYRNYHDITDSTFYVAYMPDISDCSRIFDKYEPNGERAFLFTPDETRDYYFDSDNASFIVTDIATQKTTEINGLSPVHLEKGNKYAITAIKESNADEFTIVIGTELADGYEPITGGLTSSVSYENDEPEKEPESTPSTNTVPSPSTELSFDDFVERLYVVALNRQSEKEGKDYWCELVGNGTLSGADCARFFLTSPEFKGRGLSDEEFLKVLYKTFFDRDAANDPDGFNFWMNSLKSVGKDTVVEGFINSPEWCNICADYGVRSGAPTAKATKASKNAKAFATRLYTECLGREPEEGGLNYWSLGLTNQELTGTQAARSFFYSEEFLGANYNNEEYINRMYKTFMGREADPEGKAYWLDLMSKGTTRDEVFNFFSVCEEFTGICKSYAIAR